MSGLLEGKKGIIFGALDEHSIAWKTALRCKEQGAEFILTNAPVAMRYGQIQQLAEQTNSEVVPADATSMEDLSNLFDKAIEKFGKIDFILHSIGMSINVRKNIPYTEMNYENTHKGFDISALSFHRIMKTAWEKDCMNEWGSILALSYIAAQRFFPDYNDMADNKAYLESIARSFGYHWGSEKNVRVNTISQSPTPTTAGNGVKGFGGFLSVAEEIAPLGNATADDCAQLCVMMFSDFTKRVTMQNLYNDGGYSNTGITKGLVEKFSAGSEE